MAIISLHKTYTVRIILYFIVYIVSCGMCSRVVLITQSSWFKLLPVVFVFLLVYYLRKHLSFWKSEWFRGVSNFLHFESFLMGISMGQWPDVETGGIMKQSTVIALCIHESRVLYNCASLGFRGYSLFYFLKFHSFVKGKQSTKKINFLMKKFNWRVTPPQSI